MLNKCCHCRHSSVQSLSNVRLCDPMNCSTPGLPAAAAKCDLIDGSPPGSPIPGILQTRNTGVGCHFLLQCMKVRSESEVAQSCSTLSNPTGYSLPGSSVHGIFQARVLEWGVYHQLPEFTQTHVQ